MAKKKEESFIDFDLDLDLDLDIFGGEAPDYGFRQIDLCGLVKRMKSKRKIRMNLEIESSQLRQLIDRPPTNEECYKMLSMKGGFSTLGIIKFVSDDEPIEELYVNTFRIGLRHFDELDKLHHNGKLKMAHFITSTLQRDTDRHYNYFGEISKKCKKNGWELKVLDNHSKVVLMRTKKNWHVIETSSNLNENPKMEQFSWENDKELFEWYEALMKELLKLDIGE